MYFMNWVNVIGAKCNSCGASWNSWGLNISDAPVMMKLLYPFVMTAEAVRHFMVDSTDNEHECGGRIEILTEPLDG